MAFRTMKCLARRLLLALHRDLTALAVTGGAAVAKASRAEHWDRVMAEIDAEVINPFSVDARGRFITFYTSFLIDAMVEKFGSADRAAGLRAELRGLAPNADMLHQRLSRIYCAAEVLDHCVIEQSHSPLDRVRVDDEQRAGGQLMESADRLHAVLQSFSIALGSTDTMTAEDLQSYLREKHLQVSDAASATFYGRLGLKCHETTVALFQQLHLPLLLSSVKAAVEPAVSDENSKSPHLLSVTHSVLLTRICHQIPRAVLECCSRESVGDDGDALLSTVELLGRNLATCDATKELQFLDHFCVVMSSKTIALQLHPHYDVAKFCTRHLAVRHLTRGISDFPSRSRTLDIAIAILACCLIFSSQLGPLTADGPSTYIEELLRASLLCVARPLSFVSAIGGRSALLAAAPSAVGLIRDTAELLLSAAHAADETLFHPRGRDLSPLVLWAANDLLDGVNPTDVATVQRIGRGSISRSRFLRVNRRVRSDEVKSAFARSKLSEPLGEVVDNSSCPPHSSQTPINTTQSATFSIGAADPAPAVATTDGKHIDPEVHPSPARASPPHSHVSPSPLHLVASPASSYHSQIGPTSDWVFADDGVERCRRPCRTAYAEALMPSPEAMADSGYRAHMMHRASYALWLHKGFETVGTFTIPRYWRLLRDGLMADERTTRRHTEGLRLHAYLDLMEYHRHRSVLLKRQQHTRELLAGLPSLLTKLLNTPPDEVHYADKELLRQHMAARTIQCMFRCNVARFEYRYRALVRMLRDAQRHLVRVVAMIQRWVRRCLHRRRTGREKKS